MNDKGETFTSNFLLLFHHIDSECQHSIFFCRHFSNTKTVKTVASFAARSCFQFGPGNLPLLAPAAHFFAGRVRLWLSSKELFFSSLCMLITLKLITSFHHCNITIKKFQQRWWFESDYSALVSATFLFIE